MSRPTQSGPAGSESAQPPGDSTNPAGPAGASAPPPPSKRSRIVKRTLFGGGLALGCAGLLWAVERFGSDLPVLYAGSLIALLGLIEVSLMGTLFLRAMPVILIVPLVGVGLLEYACLARPPATRPWAQLALEVVFAAALVSVVHALTRGLARRVNLRHVTILLLCAAMTGGFAWLDANDRGPLDALGAFGVFAALSLAVALAANRTEARRQDLVVCLGLALWIAVPLCALTRGARLGGVAGLVGLILLAEIGDVAGYYVGNAIGKSHPFPKLSPGKTTAGCVASLVAGVAAGGVLSAAGLLPAGSLGPLDGLLAGAVINVASQAGDLFESWVKRRARVKDSSSWLGPSGGVLDVVDSLLFSVPAALLFWPVLFGAA